jgi:hypothetical protein
MTTIRHTRQGVMRRVDAEYHALDRAVRALSRRGLDRPVPGFGKGARGSRVHWTYKDALAHILFWKQWQMETIPGRPHEGEAHRSDRASREPLDLRAVA